MTYHRGKEKKGIIIKPLVCKYLPTRLYKMAISTTASPTSAPGMLLWSWTWPPYEQKWEKKNFCLTQRPLLVQSCNIRSVNIVRLNCDDLILPLKPQTHNHPTDESWGMCCYDAEMKMSPLIDCNYLPVLWTTGWIMSSSPSWHWLPQKNVNQLFTHRSGSILKNKTLWLSEACRFKWANISIVMNKRWYFIVTLEVSDNNKPFCDGVRGPCLQRSKFCGWIGTAFLFSQ